jgi:hypothetical protein
VHWGEKALKVANLGGPSLTSLGGPFWNRLKDMMATHYCDKCMAPGGVGQPVPSLCNDGTGAHHFVPNKGTNYL